MIAVILAAVLGTSNAARAEPDALALIRDGVALRRKGSDEAALQCFRRAYEIDHSVRALAQIGLAEQALGRWALAYEHLMQALTATSDPWIATNGDALRASRQVVGQHLGRLDVLGGSPGAEVRIDGVLRGSLPLDGPLVLPIGSVTITIGGAGFVSVQRVAVIRAQEMTRESFEALARSSQTPPVDYAAMATIIRNPEKPPAPTEPGRADPLQGADRAAERTSSARASVKWIAFGTAVAAVGVGVWGYTQQSSAASQFNSGCYFDQTGTIRLKTGAQMTADGCGSLSGRVNTWYRVEVAGFVGAATLASIGLVLLLLEPTSAPARTAGLSCAPWVADRGTASLGCGWRF